MRIEILLKHTPSGRQNIFNFSITTLNGVKKYLVKPRAGSGRKRSKWMSVLCVKNVVEFEHLLNPCARFDCRLLRQLSFDISVKSTHQDCNSNSSINSQASASKNKSKQHREVA